MSSTLGVRSVIASAFCVLDRYMSDGFGRLQSTRVEGACGVSMFLTPQALMSTKLVDHIIDLTHNQHLTTIEKLCNQISWCFLDTYGSRIMDLVHQFCPPPPPPASPPFTTVPLQSVYATLSASASSVGASTAPKKKRKCGECGVKGHYSNFIIPSLI
jgi:hypothetical protein